MALKDTTTHMTKLLEEITQNLLKAMKGNKAASQRVRTGTIRLEKVAKAFRKESVAAEKKAGPKRPVAKMAAKKTAKRK